MDDKQDFERFMQTGKIEDYLRYKSSCKQEKQYKKQEDRSKEGTLHAGFRAGDRDGDQNSSCR